MAGSWSTTRICGCPARAAASGSSFALAAKPTGSGEPVPNMNCSMGSQRKSAAYTSRRRNVVVRSGFGPAPSPVFEDLQSETGGQNPGVQPDRAKAAEKPRVLDLAAAVHDDLEACVMRDLGRFLADHAELQPEDLRADLDRLTRDRGCFARGAEDVHDFDRPRVRGRGRGKIRIHRSVQDRALARLRRVHGNDVVSVRVEVDRRERACVVVVRAQADHRDRAVLGQDAVAFLRRQSEVVALSDGAHDWYGAPYALERIEWPTPCSTFARPAGGPAFCDAASAWSRSATISATSSMPIDTRTSSGPMRAARSSSSLSCWCVVEAGWMTSDFASPTLARWLKSCTDSINFCPASRPPLIPNVKMEPAPLGR